MSRPVRNKRLYGKTSGIDNPSDDKVSRKISKLVREGKDQDEAVAIAHDMKERGDL